MVKLFLVLALVATVFSLSSAGLPRQQGPSRLINRPPPPKPRFRREANPQRNSVSLDVNKPLSGPQRGPSYNLDYQHKFFENKNGHFSAGGGASKFPGQKWQPHVGVQGVWRFRREANPQNTGSVSAGVIKPLSGPERRPTYNLDYQHNIFQNKHGEISAGGGAVRFPGQKWEPQVGVQGTWRFRREANPQKNSVSVDVNKPLNGPERRPSYNVDYQHKFFENKNGHLSAGGGASKFPGQKWQPQVGIQGAWRF